jgi:MoaA/NifB/PqqE/SkfB family radical SAM enzyme
MPQLGAKIEEKSRSVFKMKGEAFLKMCAGRPPFSKMHPKMMGFFKKYLSHEKVIFFQGRYVLNTHFPPYPSPAFDTMVRNFDEVGDAGSRTLFSVTLAVTNRCTYRCWHCYNANRSQQDVPLSALKAIVARIQDLGAANVTLSGGEPLLRDDLEEIVACFDERSSLALNTTGKRLTPERALSLRGAGLFAIGISVDSSVAKEHDRMRGYPGAFKTAIDALKVTSDCGLYPYIISVGTRKFLEPDRFRSFMRFAGKAGALEVHLLEPSATGKLAGRNYVTLSDEETQRILQYQSEVAEDPKLPILSTFTYLESSAAFGCGAGLSHLYIDGSGEVCPCNLVPLSFAVSPEGREDQLRVSMSDPVTTQEVQCGLGEWHIAILGPFPTMHVDHHARAVDIGDFQVKAFVEPETAHARQFKRIRVYFRIYRSPAANTHRHPGRHLAGVQKTLKTLDSGQKHAGMTFGRLPGFVTSWYHTEYP